MRRWVVRSLLTIVTVLAATMVAPATAEANHCLVDWIDSGGRHWNTPYASTGFGPVARYSEVISTSFGKTGRVGFYSPLTGQFRPETGWMTVHESGWKSAYIAAIGESDYFFTVGYSSFLTPYGPTVWAAQFTDAPYTDDFIRWGTWNLITGRFYPSHGWVFTTC